VNNMTRHLRSVRKRAAAAHSSKLEMLAAAFLKETDLPASQVRLCQDVVNGALHVWFERNVDADPNTTAEGTDNAPGELADSVPG
jgi:hypothetical protein